MTIRIKPLTAEHIRIFVTWDYVEPYDIYNMSSANDEETVSFFLDPQNGYFAIVEEAGDLLGFCNFGADAQVPGGDYTEHALDIGMGMRPDLTGQGHGRDYAAAVFKFAEELYPQQKQRVTVAEFNQRAQRLCEHFGFRMISRFIKDGDGRPFIIMIREFIHDQEQA